MVKVTVLVPLRVMVAPHSCKQVTMYCYFNNVVSTVDIDCRVLLWHQWLK